MNAVDIYTHRQAVHTMVNLHRTIAALEANRDATGARGDSPLLTWEKNILEQHKESLKNTVSRAEYQWILDDVQKELAK